SRLSASNCGSWIDSILAPVVVNAYRHSGLSTTTRRPSTGPAAAGSSGSSSAPPPPASSGSSGTAGTSESPEGPAEGVSASAAAPGAATESPVGGPSGTAGGKSRLVPTSTPSIRTIASRKRISVFMRWVVQQSWGRSARPGAAPPVGPPRLRLPAARGPSPVRPTDGSGRSSGPRATRRGRRRGARAPPTRTPSTSACTGRRAVSRERRPRDRTARGRSGPSGPRRLQGLHQLPLQGLVLHFVGRASCAHEQVGRLAAFLERWKDVPPADLAQPALQPVPLDDPPPVLRHHEPEPGTRSGGSADEDVQIPRPLALPPLQQRADLGPARHACVPRQALAPRRRGAGPYLPPILTVSR